MDSNKSEQSMAGDGRRDLIGVVRERQQKFFGPVMRREGLESLTMPRMMEGRRGRERPREKCMDGPVKLVRGGKQRQQFIQAVQKREGWKSLAADVLEDKAQQ